MGKKDGDHRSVINLKSFIDVSPIFISKRDVFTVKAINIGQALDVQTGIEESILQCFTKSKLQKIHIFVKGENLSVPLPMLWTGFNTAVVYKITKNVSFPLRKISIRVTMIDISILSYMIQASYVRQDTELRQKSSHIPT